LQSPLADSNRRPLLTIEARGASYPPVMPTPFRPSKQEIAAAEGASVADVIAPGLAVLFCGINPGLYSGAVGHHFARPGNRFWKALHAAGFTPRVLSPFEERALLDHSLGITNLVNRATATATGVSDDELRRGAVLLRRKVRRYRPGWIAMLGLSTYRVAFRRPRADVGPQDQMIGDTGVWLLPNPSGLNAHYQVADLARVFSELREAAA
jgi:TDG/mug DNA glycosylase family protein